MAEEQGTHILETVGDLLPDRGALGVLKRIVEKDDKIQQEDRQELLALIGEIRGHRGRDHRQVGL